jgi:hypothetical protein
MYPVVAILGLLTSRQWGRTGRHKAQPLPETERGNPGILIGYGRGCALCLPVRLVNGTVAITPGMYEV